MHIAQHNSLSLVLNLKCLWCKQLFRQCPSERFPESHAERRLPGEKQIGSAAIWPNDRCCWAQLFLLVNACTASDASTEPHIQYTRARAAEVISSLSWCVSWRGTAGRTGANECTARFQGCICLNPHRPTFSAGSQFEFQVEGHERARARKINRRAWNNNKRVRGTKLCDVNAQLSDRIHLHSLTQRKCKTHANARGAGTNLNFIELSLRRLSRRAVFRVCALIWYARPPPRDYSTHTITL